VRRALRADGATAILVTHDQGEALSMADQVAVMRAGRIVQCGPPTSVYREPADPWVAGFVGEAVLLPATVLTGRGTSDRTGDGDRAGDGTGDGTGDRAGDGTGAVALTPLGRVTLREPAGGTTATVLLRPEQVRLAVPDGGSPGDGALATVVRHDFHGHDALVHLRLADGTPVTARVLDSSPPVAVGDEVRVAVRGAARAFPAG
jgi:iron(III) transport system ATP-binding protein